MSGTAACGRRTRDRKANTPGLDQISFPLSLNLRGSGLVNVTVTATGVVSNAVQLDIQSNPELNDLRLSFLGNLNMPIPLIIAASSAIFLIAAVTASGFPR